MDLLEYVEAQLKRNAQLRQELLVRAQAETDELERIAQQKQAVLNRAQREADRLAGEDRALQQLKAVALAEVTAGAAPSENHEIEAENVAG